ncbi:MAG: hypothetical protein H6819_07500 [Phycisphaerales bacterium]|nr:hypothetical protein [Phycisphaerales bacterium]MCB9857661.1 hypothetical protein [Phycisphaerales bacterium]
MSFVASVGCIHPHGESNATSSCYEGPIDVHVQYPDGAPAANLPIGFGAMLWIVDPSTGESVLHERTWRTDENGDCRRDRWRECMLPTMLYAIDVPRQLAALKPILRYDALEETHRLTLNAACRVTGRVSDANLGSRDTDDRLVLVKLNPGTTLTSRYIKYQTADGQFSFLVPPGEYTMSISTAQAQSNGIRVDVPRGASRLDVGDVRFEMFFEYAPAER